MNEYGIKCDKSHMRWIQAWQEHYCVSSKRKKPVAVNYRDELTFQEFCCKDYKECPYYPSLLARLIKRDRIEAPRDC